MSDRSVLTILFIDHCAEDRAAYRHFLQQDSLYTYQILEFETATEAMKWCQQEIPDVILLDFLLPDGDGLEFLQQFREHLSSTQSTVIILTGHEDTLTAVQAMKSGAQDYLVKNKLTPEILQRAVQSAVERMHLTRQIEQSREQQQLIAAIALQISQSLNLAEILRVTTTEVRQFLKTDRVLIYQFHPDMSGTIVAESVLPGWPATLAKQIQDTYFQQRGRTDYLQGRKQAINDIYQASLTRCYLEILERFEVKAILVVPILVFDQLWGLLVAHQCSASRHWQSAELELLDQLAVQISLAIQRASVYKQVQAELAERKEAEEALRESEERFRNTFEQAAVGMCHISPCGDFLRFNQRVCDIVGYSAAELLTLSFQEITHPEDLLTDLELMNKLLSGEIRTYSLEKRYIRKDRSLVWISLTVSLVREHSGEPKYFISVIEDITTRKQAEEELRRVEKLQIELQLLENILDVARVGYWDWDIPGNQEYFSPTLKRMFGYENYELPNTTQTRRSLIFPEDLPVVLKCFDQHVKSRGQIPYYNEVRYQHQNGSIVWVICSGRVIEWDQDGNPLRMIGCLIDITQRQQAQQLLKINEARYRAIVEDQTELIARFSPDATIVFVNEAYCRYFDLQREEMIGKSYEPVIFEEDRETVMQLVQSMSAENPTVTLDYRVVINGEIRWTQWINRRLIDKQGQFVEIQSVGRDITKLKQTEAALRESERRFAALAKAAPVAIFRLDPAGNCVYVNDRWGEMTGRPLQTGLGMGWVEALYPEDRDRILREWSQKFELGVGLGEGFQTEGRHLRPDGSTNWFYSQVIPETDISGTMIGYIGTLTDISDYKQAGQELIRSRDLREAIFNESADALFLVDPATLLILDCNRQAVELFAAASKAELLGIDGQTLQRYQFSAEETAASVAELQSRGFWSREIEYVTHKGSLFWGNIAAKPITVAEHTLHLIRVTDISDRKRAEEQLHNLSARLTLALKSGPIGIWEWDIVQNVLIWDDRMYELYGMQRTNVVEPYHLWLKAVHPNDRVKAETAIQDALRGEREFDPEFRVVHPDGTIRFIKAYALMQRNQQGEPQSMIGINYDITDRKAVEALLQQKAQQEQLLRVITERVRQSLNLDEILETAVAEVRQTFQADRVLIFRLLPEGKGQIIKEAVVSAYPSMGEGEWTDVCLSPNNPKDYHVGKQRIVPDVALDQWGECLGQLLHQFGVKSKISTPIIQTRENGSTQIWGLLIVHSCTHYRQWFSEEARLLQRISNQLAIAIQQADLYQRIQTELVERKQAEAQLQQTNEQLARATRLKDEFLANMSHELRTPLNAILGMSEGFQEGVFGIINERQVKAITTIERSGQHLLALINDILDLSKIASGKLELQISNVSIKSLCETSLAFVKQMALKKNICLSSRISNTIGSVQVDERRLRQVLINLLSNAVKFTPPGGSVTLDVWIEQESGEKILHHSITETPSCHNLCFSVIDTGIGIAPENIDKLFESFIQLDSSLSRQYDGTGLGLALVKQLTTLHQGTVSVSSNMDRGSCFTIRIPYRLSDHASLKPEAALLPMTPPQFQESLGKPQPYNGSRASALMTVSSVAVQPPLILLAEDNQANIDTISSYLESRGYRLILAKTGQQAINLAKTQLPDLILMDIQLPEMDGIEALRRLRSEQQFAGVPIIVLTALAMQDDQQKCLKAGASEYLIKPVKLKLLTATIQRLLKR